jgi:hypothetical protein
VAWATQLARTLKASLHMEAESASSNARILRTTRTWLDERKNSVEDKLVVIQWSTWEREEWEYQGQYYNVNSSGHDQLPDVLITKYKQWVIEQTPETLVGKSQHTHEKIYKLHCELTEKQIPHVFFNCMYNFFEITNQLNWNHSYIGPYENDASYYWYLKKRNFAADNWYHYGEDGHKAWANFLIKYIEENKIL